MKDQPLVPELDGLFVDDMDHVGVGRAYLAVQRVLVFPGSDGEQTYLADGSNDQPVK